MNRYLVSKRPGLVLSLIISLGIWSVASAQNFPDSIPLPDGLQPEGITLGTGHTAYVGTLTGGSIYEVDLKTGEVGILVQGTVDNPYIPSQIAVGLAFDDRSGYLFVAGGLWAHGRVYDTKTGDLAGDPLLFGPGWINDVVITRDAAYFTNSFLPEIWKVPLTSQGIPHDVPQPLPLAGDWIQITGEMVINANGIVATPDGTKLIVVNYATGMLYGVDPDTGLATAINLGGMLVPFGDGLILKGRTLYVVQNFHTPFNSPGQITVFKMDEDYTAATLMSVLGADEPFVPSTAIAFGPWLYAVNARFDECMPAVCDPTDKDIFEIVRVDQ